MKKNMAKFRLGIDIGGTFTDFSLLNEDTGGLISLKSPSTPRAPANAVTNGLQTFIEESGLDTSEIIHFVHGGTIAVNTIIQRNGANLSLFVTEGFADLLEIQRLRLFDVWDLLGSRPKSLVPREQCMSIRERIRADGTIETPLEKESVTKAVQRALSQEVDGIVICFLNSYKNPIHELRVRDMIVDQAPQLIVSCSSEVWPEIREYERSMVAVINSYVRPKTEGYLTDLENVVKENNIKVTPYITKSNGGVMSLQRAKLRGAEILLSGPASGVIGATYVAGFAGFKDIITLDMGGTSTDIALVNDGRPHYSTEDYIGEFPIIIPVVAVSCIGAGGGSIAWVDDSGVLKIGPDSAGADPGPACYGIGGTKPTMTDAYLICGFLNPATFAGGRQKLHRRLAEEAIGAVAEVLGLDVVEAAQEIIKVATANMYVGISRVLSRRGLDARDFTLVPFGGAGPTQACLVAQEFNIDKIFVSMTPGTLSALGALCSDVKTEFIRSINLKTNEISIEQLRKGFDELKTQAAQYIEEEGFPVNNIEMYLSADMNYVSQAFQVEVPVDEKWLTTEGFSEIEKGFHRTHHLVYGHSDESSPTQIMSLRVTVVGTLTKPTFNELEKSAAHPQPTGRRDIYCDGKSWQASIYERRELRWGSRIDGPAIVEQADSTVVILDNYVGNVDRYGNIVITRKEGR